MTTSSAGDLSDRAVARSTAAMTVLTALSRVTGLVRLLVMAAVLGTTFLGNTYESANTVPNLLFELFAAGMLQAVLVPTLVGLLDTQRRSDAEHVAGSVLGLTGIGLAVMAGVGIVFAEPLMRGLVSGVGDADTQAAQAKLGAVFLRFFLPQVVLYVAGLVATAVLNAHGRFAVPVFAPIVNNVVVTAAYVMFHVMREGASPSLDLTTGQQVVLAGGTTLGVLAFCSVPVVAALRLGFSLRPRFDYRDPRVRELGRRGAWAALYLAMTQVLLAVLLVLANRVEGGVIAYRVAFTFFLLPHALFAIPVFTALYPRMSREAQAAAWDGYSRSVTQGLRVIALLVLPATAVFVAAAHAVTDVALFGASADGSTQVATALMGFAPGLIGYGGFLLATRAFYAAGNTRTPALVNAGMVVAASVGMAVIAAVVPDRRLVGALGLVHSVAYVGATVVLVAMLRHHVPFRIGPGFGRAAASALLGAALAGVAIAGVDSVVDGTGRAASLGMLVVAVAVGGALYAVVQRLAGGVRPAAFVDLLRSGPS